MKKEFHFDSEGSQLSAALVYPEQMKDKNPAILFFHGLTGHKESCDQYATGLAKIGYISMIFDMRGHGQSPGNVGDFSLRNFLDDCKNAYDYFAVVKGIDKDNISFVATSMGSCLAANLSINKKARNLVLRAPADYPNKVFDEPTIEHGGENLDTKKWRHEKKDFGDSFALQAVHSFDGNILFIESEKDDLVPHTTVENYINAVKNKAKVDHVLIKGAPHSIKEGKFRDEVERVLVDWFRNR